MSPFPVINATLGSDFVQVIGINLNRTTIQPANARCGFWYVDDGVVRTGTTAGASPSTNAGNWRIPDDSLASLYQLRITRTGGSETQFTGGELGGVGYVMGTWIGLETSPIFYLDTNENSAVSRSLIFSIDIRLTSTGAIVAGNTGNQMTSTVEL